MSNTRFEVASVGLVTLFVGVLLLLTQGLSTTQSWLASYVVSGVGMGISSMVVMHDNRWLRWIWADWFVSLIVVVLLMLFSVVNCNYELFMYAISLLCGFVVVVTYDVWDILR